MWNILVLRLNLYFSNILVKEKIYKSKFEKIGYFVSLYVLNKKCFYKIVENILNF